MTQNTGYRFVVSGIYNIFYNTIICILLYAIVGIFQASDLNIDVVHFSHAGVSDYKIILIMTK